MMLPEGIELLPIEKWENKHENFKQSLKKNASFKLVLPDSTDSHEAKYHATTANFQWLIGHAIQHDLSLRALGSGWSFSKVGVTEGGVIDTVALNLTFNLGTRFIAPQYQAQGGQAHDLFFAQCGNTIKEINKHLEQKSHPKRALKASGASNGQTIVGAMSTGTHGAAFKVGAVPDFVVGLHLVMSPTRHVYLERASYPVTSDSFGKWLGAEIIRDDALFNAALVSFGSFGFIHGVLLETEPIFLLERYDRVMPYNQSIKRAIDQLDFSYLPLPHPLEVTERSLYHFELVVNPYDFKPDNAKKGVYMKIMYKNAYNPDYPKKENGSSGGYTYGDDALGVIQTLIDHLQGRPFNFIPILANSLFPLAYKRPPMEETKGRWGTIGEMFGSSGLRGQAASGSMGVDIQDATRVLQVLLDLHDDKPFPGAFALRFVKGSTATLGFTRFPQTCVIEMDGVDSKYTRKFFTSVWNRLDELGIRFTLHWGKINFHLNAKTIRNMYGEAAVQAWIDSRNTLLDAPTRKVFSNEFIRRCGLDVPPSSTA